MEKTQLSGLSSHFARLWALLLPDSTSLLCFSSLHFVGSLTFELPSRRSSVVGIVESVPVASLQAAMRCQPDVVKFVLKNAADPKAILEVKDDENRKTAEDYSHECQGNQTARNETLRLLQQKRI